MAVQARMFVQKITQNSYNPEAREVTLTAITRGSEASEWSKHTPSATLTMQITNPAANEQFAIGHEFLLTFEDVTPAPATPSKGGVDWGG